MKWINCLCAAVLFAFCFSSCSDDGTEEGAGVVDSARAITFRAELSNFGTRVNSDGNGWSRNDVIGAYMLPSGGEEAYDGAANVPYQCEEEGITASFSSQKPFALPEKGSGVKFIAYYPYDRVTSNFSYRVRLADQSKGTGVCDLMYGTSDYALPGESAGKNIPLAFKHQLTKVVMKFVDKDNLPLLADGEITIKGMPVAAYFDLRSGKLTADNIEAPIILYTNAEAGSYDAMVLPSDVTADYKVHGTIGGKPFEWKLTSTDINLPTLQKGFKYVFTIPVHNGEAGTGKVEQIDGGMSSSPWNEGEEAVGMAGVINYELFPENSGAFADTELKLTFKGDAPALGTQGYIRIYQAKDGKLVDEIDMAEREVPIVEGQTKLNSWMDIIGVTPKASKRNRKRIVNYHAVQVDGNTVVVKPHSNRLNPGETYYVTVDRTAIRQKDFKGIGGRKWLFSTKESPVLGDEKTVRVSHTNLQADFYTLQGAIDYFALQVDRDMPKTILLDDGIYEEMINLRDQDRLTVKGTGRDKVFLRYDNRNSFNPGVGEGADVSQDLAKGTVVPQSGNRSVLTVSGDADKIRFEDITIENTAGNNGQAEAIILRNNGGATAFVNCTFNGYQDTILGGGGYNWFYKCLVTGATDFIWGGPVVTLFEECEIRAINRGRALNARVAENNLGYVFSHCRFTVSDNVTQATSLIEPSTYDNLTFLHTTFANVFVQGGIPTLNPSVPSATKGCKMYDCVDEKGLQVHQEIAGKENIYALSKEEFDTHYASRGAILGGYPDASWFIE